MFTSAIFSAERLVYQNKSNPNSWFLLALSYYKANKIKSALVLLKDLPGKYLDDNGLFLLGKLALKVKDYRLAEDVFSSLLDLPLPDVLPHAQLAESRRCHRP
ncbi:hypothetical protein DSO57_1007698 [Entomophthora muscae]|uniref:Uncharacterized protein n=1 Tax=Entomophthora muscae TaxID=34485 RepID=A0ACC2SW54_9FUNG|nr:hypothetical protein DSO57_1007698 [Entomophthora muscae]